MQCAFITTSPVDLIFSTSVAVRYNRYWVVCIFQCIANESLANPITPNFIWYFWNCLTNKDCSWFLLGRSCQLIVDMCESDPSINSVKCESALTFLQFSSCARCLKTNVCHSCLGFLSWGTWGMEESARHGPGTPGEILRGQQRGEDKGSRQWWIIMSLGEDRVFISPRDGRSAYLKNIIF